jgi:FlaA1/EpsC-like NDP-sugar epimerase
MKTRGSVSGIENSWAANRPNYGRPGLFLGLYASGLALSLWLAYQFRFDFRVPSEFKSHFPLVCLWVVAIKLAMLHGFGQFQALKGYFGIPSLLRIIYALASGSLMVGLTSGLLGLPSSPPHGVILVDLVLAVVVIASIRLALRMLRERASGKRNVLAKQPRRVAIIGAGDAGVDLAQELRLRRGLGLEPVAFFDDDPKKWNAIVHNIPVVGPPELLRNGIVKKLGLEEVIISMPSAPADRVRDVVSILQTSRLDFKTVPSLAQIATGEVRLSQIRSVEVEDVLGRPPVRLETKDIQAMLAGRTVMVTGAGGSIGSELCRQIASFKPARLLLIERSESHLFVIEQELIRGGHGNIVTPVVADIFDKDRMRRIFGQFRPEVIFHAAAHKHVPMMENQPEEAIKNNVLGSVLMAELSREFEAGCFVLISTDKAINPTSVMGATKRLAEIFLQSFHAGQPGKTRFMAVRFGNVLGSSGSVIPTFKNQIAAGGPVTVTHPEMKRYFMTIPEAVGLVLQSGAQGTGGEIFVLDMGKPVKIVDLARQLIQLSGLRPDKDIRIEYVGLRPGEKLFEELSYKDEFFTPTHHPKIMRLKNQPLPLEDVRAYLRELAASLSLPDARLLKMILKKGVPEYTPFMADASARVERDVDVKEPVTVKKSRPARRPNLNAQISAKEALVTKVLDLTQRRALTIPIASCK